MILINLVFLSVLGIFLTGVHNFSFNCIKHHTIIRLSYKAKFKSLLYTELEILTKMFRGGSEVHPSRDGSTQNNHSILGLNTDAFIEP